MSVVFTIKEESNGLWGVYRDCELLIKQLTAAAAIKDGRELARLIHGQSGEAVTVALETPYSSILLARYARPAPMLKLVAA
jgi:hypothetical protein